MTIVSCNERAEINFEKKVDWSKRTATITNKDSLTFGKTYLSIYSQIYSFFEDKKVRLKSNGKLKKHK